MTSRKCGWIRPSSRAGTIERGLLVLDQVGHELHDRVLDLGGQPSTAADQSTAVAGSHWLRGRRGVEPRRDVGPDVLTVRPLGADRRAARLDQRAARREAPALVGAAARRAAAARRPAPRRASALARPVALGDHAAVARVGHRRGRCPCARHQAARWMRERRVPPGDRQPVAGRQPRERPLDEQVPARCRDRGRSRSVVARQPYPPARVVVEAGLVDRALELLRSRRAAAAATA